MSKHLKAGTTTSVPLADIHWFYERNQRVETGTLPQAKAPKSGASADGGVFEDIRDNGWTALFPAEAYNLPDGKYNADLAIQERKQWLAEWEADEKTAAVAEVMRRVWTDGKGKFHRPILGGNTGYRRGRSLPFILAEKVKLVAVLGGSFDPRSFVVPVLVQEYATELDRITAMSRENAARELKGIQNLTWPDRLKTAAAILKEKGNENAVRKALGDGNGQKAYAILTANNKVPKLRILDRINMPAPTGDEAGKYVEGGHIPASKVRHQDLKDALENGHVERYIASLFGVKPDGTPIEGAKRNRVPVLARPAWQNVLDTQAQAGSPMAAIADAHLYGRGFAGIQEKYPELFVANYVGGTAQDTGKAGRKAGRKAGAKA